MDHAKIIQALHTQQFWVTILSALLLVANQGLGLNIPANAVLGFAGIIIAWVLGSSHVAAQHVQAMQAQANAAPPATPQGS
jgi:hypothetical protein